MGRGSDSDLDLAQEDAESCEAAGGVWEKDVDGYYSCSIAFFVAGLVCQLRTIRWNSPALMHNCSFMSRCCCYCCCCCCCCCCLVTFSWFGSATWSAPLHLCRTYHHAIGRLPFATSDRRIHHRGWLPLIVSCRIQCQQHWWWCKNNHSLTHWCCLLVHVWADFEWNRPKNLKKIINKIA